MLTRFGAAPLVLVAAFALSLLVGAPDRALADDSYTPTVPTSCRVEAVATHVRQRVVLEVEVTANTTEPVDGVVDLAVRRIGTKAVLWSRSLRYEGAPLRVTGPRLPRGRFEVRMSFTPTSDEYDACRADVRLGVRAGGSSPDEPTAGALPDTGGPPASILLFGLGLLASGGALVRARPRARAV